MPESVYYSTMESPAGRLTVAVSERGLFRLGWDSSAARQQNDLRWIESPERTAAVCEQLDEYFAGQRRVFDLPLDLRGTDFQRRVWQALLKIPYGETRSYGQIAAQVGSPNASRAVGQVNHWNPVAIVVP